jgi:hypothetical protein
MSSIPNRIRKIPPQECIDALQSGATTRRAFWWKQDQLDVIDDNVNLGNQSFRRGWDVDPKRIKPTPSPLAEGLTFARGRRPEACQTTHREIRQIGVNYGNHVGARVWARVCAPKFIRDIQESRTCVRVCQKVTRQFPKTVNC